MSVAMSALRYKFEEVVSKKMALQVQLEKALERVVELNLENQRLKAKLAKKASRKKLS